MAQNMVHLTVIETLSKRGQQKQQQFHTHEELFSSGQSKVAINKCRAGIFPEYSKLQWHFIYLCFQALCKLSYIFSSTFSWSCNIWFDILANWIAITSAQGDSFVAIRWTFSLSNKLMEAHWKQHLFLDGLRSRISSHTRLTMEPFPEKPTANVASTSVCVCTE